MAQDGYEARSRIFLAQAREELGKGDSVQASEKLWGAAAQMVKAVAQRRGWPHNSHRKLYEVINRLVEETADQDINALFQVAGNLHVNFYENWQPLETVSRTVPLIERLVAKLEAL